MKGIAISLFGLTLAPFEVALLQSPSVMGVVLFQENYRDKKQLSALSDAIKAIRSDLVIMVDQEGGSVQRFSRPKESDGDALYFDPLPSLHTFGLAYDQAQTEQDRQSVLLDIKASARKNAASLLACGVDLLLGPIVDLHDDSSPIIGGMGRAFHHDPSVIIIMAKAYLDGMEEAGMVRGVLKHFPGHGSIASVDSHLDTVVLDGEVPELPIFQTLIQEANSFGIMQAHVCYPHYDPDHVVGTSPIFHQLLRNKWAYTGTVFSDCLSMKGAHGVAQGVLMAMKGKPAIARFKAALLALIKHFAPFHDVLILTHGHTLWQNLLPEEKPIDDERMATIMAWVLSEYASVMAT